MRTLQQIAEQLNLESFLGITDWQIAGDKQFPQYWHEGKFLQSASKKAFKTLPGAEVFFKDLRRRCAQLPQISSPTLGQYPRLWDEWYCPYIAEFKVEISGKEQSTYLIHRLPSGEITTYDYCGIMPGYYPSRKGKRMSGYNPEKVHLTFERRGSSAECMLADSWSRGDGHTTLRFPS